MIKTDSFVNSTKSFPNVQYANMFGRAVTDGIANIYIINAETLCVTYVHRYNIANNQWITMNTTGPGIFTFSGCVFVNNLIYIIGGSSHGLFWNFFIIRDVYLYDINNNIWEGH